MNLDETLILKMEKCAAQFSTAFRSLSKVFALMGKNGTTIPVFSLDHDPKNDQNEEIGNSAPENEEIGTPETSFDQSRSTSSDRCARGALPRSTVVQNSAWDKLCRCRWGIHHATDFIQPYIYDLRANNAKITWRLSGSDPTVRANWTRVGDSVVRERFHMYCEDMLELRVELQREQRQDTDRWNKIHRVKRNRAYRVLEAEPVTLKVFYKHLYNRHAELPALRGL